jgi:hypothetical protein
MLPRYLRFFGAPKFPVAGIGQAVAGVGGTPGGAVMGTSTDTMSLL